MFKKDLKVYAAFLILLFVSFSSYAAQDPLPSWNEGPIKQKLIQFVNEVTDKNSSHYVVPEDRVATFDNDGTMWVEQPLYTQYIFALDRVAKMAPQHPEWKTEQPFASVLAKDYSKLSEQDFEKIFITTQTGMSVEDYKSLAQQWLQVAENTRFQKHYTQLVYLPMLEAMNYLRQNNFRVYIVSGGGQDFIRSFAPQIYQVPLENIIGAAIHTQYTYKNDQPQLIKIPKVVIIDDKSGKPEGINLFIGKKPIIAFGNSDGDRQMLEWTQSNGGEHLMLLVHHDDAAREYAYGAQSKIGTFSDSLMTEANTKGWQVISMKNDWKTIFSFEHAGN
ncbi:MAG TPA: HAD family hydrolase [Coxiellaceae bacterium]|nr:HAD family hydrolase [Coxiellaceae bacterium]